MCFYGHLRQQKTVTKNPIHPKCPIKTRKMNPEVNKPDSFVSKINFKLDWKQQHSFTRSSAKTAHFFLSPLSGGSEEWYSVLQGHRRAGPLFSERDHRSTADGVSLLWEQQLQGLVRSSMGQQQIPGLHLQRCQGVSESHGWAAYEKQGWWIIKRMGCTD